MFFSQQRKREKRFLKQSERWLFNAKFDPEQHVARGKSVQFGFINVPEPHFKRKYKKNHTHTQNK